MTDNRPSGIITLLTDFGMRDAWVGAMKGVILGINPSARIVDLTHEIAPYDILAGALMLRSAAPHFPSGTIHIAVVDPGVGGNRKPIVLQTKEAFFIGPDNGLLTLSAQKVVRGIGLSRTKYFNQPVSSTFHGRDIFAPVAAHTSKGIRLDDLGTRLKQWKKLALPAVRIDKTSLQGQVIHVDRFGNLITNIEDNVLMRWLGIRSVAKVRISLGKNPAFKGLSQAYSEAAEQEPLALVGSTGYLEIAVNQGKASKRFRVEVGTLIVLSTNNAI